MPTRYQPLIKRNSETAFLEINEAYLATLSTVQTSDEVAPESADHELQVGVVECHYLFHTFLEKNLVMSSIGPNRHKYFRGTPGIVPHLPIDGFLLQVYRKEWRFVAEFLLNKLAQRDPIWRRFCFYFLAVLVEKRAFLLTQESLAIAEIYPPSDEMLLQPVLQTTALCVAAVSAGLTEAVSWFEIYNRPPFPRVIPADFYKALNYTQCTPEGTEVPYENTGSYDFGLAHLMIASIKAKKNLNPRHSTFPQASIDPQAFINLAALLLLKPDRPIAELPGAADLSRLLVPLETLNALLSGAVPTAQNKPFFTFWELISYLLGPEVIRQQISDWVPTLIEIGQRYGRVKAVREAIWTAVDFYDADQSIQTNLLPRHPWMLPPPAIVRAAELNLEDVLVLLSVAFWTTGDIKFWCEQQKQLSILHARVGISSIFSLSIIKMNHLLLNRGEEEQRSYLVSISVQNQRLQFYTDRGHGKPVADPFILPYNLKLLFALKHLEIIFANQAEIGDANFPHAFEEAPNAVLAFAVLCTLDKPEDDPVLPPEDGDPLTYFEYYVRDVKPLFKKKHLIPIFDAYVLPALLLCDDKRLRIRTTMLHWLATEQSAFLFLAIERQIEKNGVCWLSGARCRAILSNASAIGQIFNYNGESHLLENPGRTRWSQELIRRCFSWHKFAFLGAEVALSIEFGPAPLNILALRTLLPLLAQHGLGVSPASTDPRLSAQCHLFLFQLSQFTTDPSLLKNPKKIAIACLAELMSWTGEESDMAMVMALYESKRIDSNELLYICGIQTEDDDALHLDQIKNVVSQFRLQLYAISRKRWTPSEVLTLRA